MLTAYVKRIVVQPQHATFNDRHVGHIPMQMVRYSNKYFIY